MPRPARRLLALLACAVLLAACRGEAPGPATGQQTDPGPPPTDVAEPTEVVPHAPASPPAPPTPQPGPDPTADTAVCRDALGCYGEPERLGRFDPEAIPQASGLAASRRNPGLLYLLDDRPGASEVWAVRTDGSLLGPLVIAGMDARDGESLAIGPCGPDADASCLYVGDIGDNRRDRDDIVVHRVPEPDLAGALPDAPLEGDRVRLRYPDRPHDAEALLVDDHARLHIVTKAPFDRQEGTTGETRLHRLDAFGDGVLTDLGRVPVPEAAGPVQSTFVGDVVTGGSYLAGRVLLRTYDQVLEYIAPDGPDGADLAELGTWTLRAVPSPLEPQSEAVTWAADGCGYLTAGEMVGDIWLVPCLP